MKTNLRKSRPRFTPRAALFAHLVLLSLWACAPSPSRVPVLAESHELHTLVGSWSGTYFSASGSSGSITFVLAAQSDTAFGEVIMFDERKHRTFVPNAPPFSEEDQLAHKQVLPIRFVRVIGNRISGELASHVDAVSGCVMTTLFEGQLTPDEMSGTFISRFVGSLETRSGTWRVRREKTGDKT